MSRHVGAAPAASALRGTYDRCIETFVLSDEGVRGPRVPNGRGRWLTMLSPDSPAATSPCLCTSTLEWMKNIRKDEAGVPSPKANGHSPPA